MSVRPSVPGLFLAIIGTAFQAGTVLAVLRISAALIPAFAKLSQSGLGDPTELAPACGELLDGSVACLGFGLAGLILLTIALTGARYRAGWFFWFLFIYGLLSLAVVPVGTAFGIFFLVYTRRHRQEFDGTPSIPPNQR